MSSSCVQLVTIHCHGVYVKRQSQQCIRRVSGHPQLTITTTMTTATILAPIIPARTVPRSTSLPFSRWGLQSAANGAPLLPTTPQEQQQKHHHHQPVPASWRQPTAESSRCSLASVRSSPARALPHPSQPQEFLVAARSLPPATRTRQSIRSQVSCPPRSSTCVGRRVLCCCANSQRRGKDTG